jgi:DNA-binding MarR family transcriptional regulator
MTSSILLSDADALDLCVRLGQAQAFLTKRFDRALSSSHGVSYGDYLILAHLWRAPYGRLRRVDLAAAVGLSASGVTRALGPLERRGLVERQPNPRDARVAYASLTDAGRVLVADVETVAARVAGHSTLDAGWGTDHRDLLVELLDGLGAIGLPSASDPDRWR